MKASEKEELEACLKRVSEILYANSDPEKLETLEDIEKTVRDKVLEHISPKIAFFLSKKRQKQIKEKKGK